MLGIAPVPLPRHPLEAQANKSGGSLRLLPEGAFEMSDKQPRLKQVLSDSTATRPSITSETPVPLPMSVRQTETFAASASKKSTESLSRSMSPAPSKRKHILVATDDRPYSVYVSKCICAAHEYDGFVLS